MSYKDKSNSIKKKITANLQNIKNLIVNAYGIGQFNADLPFLPIHYKNTFVSVVMCAFPHTENCCHLHSSTFNPIYSGHPIIQFGPYKSLERMKFLSPLMKMVNVLRQSN